MIEIGKPLPKPDLQAINYYRISYRPGHEYVNATDASGHDIITRQICESNDEFRSRKGITNPRHHLAGIVNKYYSAARRNETVRDERLVEFFNNNQSVLDNALQESEIIGKSFILLENNVDGQILSAAQAASAGVEEYLVFIPAEALRIVETVDGNVINAVIVFESSDGSRFAREYDMNGMAREITINQKNETVESIGEWYSTGYTVCPLFGVLPKTELVPILADSQKTIANLQSLLAKELFDHTFSQSLLSGLDLSGKTEEEIARMRLEMARNRFICVGESVSVSNLGSQIEQAESIRKAIADEEDNLYRIAGLKQPDAVAGTSGVAKIIEADDFYIVLNDLVTAMEKAENKIISAIGDRIGTVYEVSYYSREFSTPDYQKSILELRDVLSLNIPQEFKDRAIAKWAGEYFEEEA